jgi:hypothetical protein
MLLARNHPDGLADDVAMEDAFLLRRGNVGAASALFDGC